VPKYEFVCVEGHKNLFNFTFAQYDVLVKEQQGKGLACGTCGEEVKGKISVVGIIFKGSGFTVSGRV